MRQHAIFGINSVARWRAPRPCLRQDLSSFVIELDDVTAWSRGGATLRLPPPPERCTEHAPDGCLTRAQPKPCRTLARAGGSAPSASGQPELQEPDHQTRGGPGLCLPGHIEEHQRSGLQARDHGAGTMPRGATRALRFRGKHGPTRSLSGFGFTRMTTSTSSDARSTNLSSVLGCSAPAPGLTSATSPGSGPCAPQQAGGGRAGRRAHRRASSRSPCPSPSPTTPPASPARSSSKVQTVALGPCGPVLRLARMVTLNL